MTKENFQIAASLYDQEAVLKKMKVDLKGSNSGFVYDKFHQEVWIEIEQVIDRRLAAIEQELMRL